MVKESDLSEASRNSFLTQYTFEVFDDRPWTEPPPKSERRVAMVSTAAIHAPEDRPFGFGAYDFRALPRSQRQFLCSHNSVNWDRTGMMRDMNVAYPIDRLEEICEEGGVGSVADQHYAFNGGTDDVARYETHAKRAAAAMKAEGVNTVVLVPV